jgi:hypothetical protein
MIVHARRDYAAHPDVNRELIMVFQNIDEDQSLFHSVNSAEHAAHPVSEMK